MKFNNFLWDLYKNSVEGRAAIGRDIADHKRPWIQLGSAPFDATLFFCEDFEDETSENGINGFHTIDLRSLIREFAVNQRIADLEAAESFFIKIIDKGLSFPFDKEEKFFSTLFAGGQYDQKLYEDATTFIEGLSAGLSDAHPEFFISYLFVCQFDVFEQICSAFDISLPQTPGKRQKRERALYYLAINRVLQDFRKKYQLSPQELNAFLYDFAPKNLPILAPQELPPPSRVWFVIGGAGGNGDFEDLDAASEKSVYRWHGNLETRHGDIVLMWCASPRSYLHSVWRALGEGFVDPFFYHYSTIRVGHPVKITPIPFSEISKHPLLGVKPAVRARFQGTSGTAFALEDYEAICEILRHKKFDTSQIPLPPDVKEFFVTGIETERGVELHLLEPLLHRIGYAEDDWIRQLSVRMGRGERNYPDYVLGGNPQFGEESALAVIECKFDITTNKELKEAFIQAKSYALRLQASIVALAARRGFWIFKQRTDGFSIDHFIFKTWEELAYPDVLHSVSLSIGKSVVDKLAAQRKRNRISN